MHGHTMISGAKSVQPLHIRHIEGSMLRCGGGLQWHAVQRVAITLKEVARRERREGGGRGACGTPRQAHPRRSLP